VQRLFIADVHLEPSQPLRLAALAGLLRSRQSVVDEIYLLGDLCEMWIGDDDDDDLALAIQRLLATTADHCKLYFMHGNRDFLIGNRFAASTNCMLLDDPHRLADGTLLSHGDSLCTDDAEYQKLREVLRSTVWQAETLARPLDERRTMGLELRARSRAENANKAVNIMDVNAAAVTGLLDKQHAQRLIHGHTHRPGTHADAAGRRRWVLGTWERCGWWLEQNATELQLRCASLTTLAGS
jgi:UDP-2,3-diacylglucosamine hydrolase